jgi:hypothetical protein
VKKATAVLSFSNVNKGGKEKVKMWMKVHGPKSYLVMAIKTLPRWVWGPEDGDIMLLWTLVSTGESAWREDLEEQRR